VGSASLSSGVVGKVVVLEEDRACRSAGSGADRKVRGKRHWPSKDREKETTWPRGECDYGRGY